MAQDMTKEEIKKIYHNAVSAYSKDLDIVESYSPVETIVSSERAWGDYYRAFRAMKSRAEPIYKRPIGRKLTRCFLELILDEDGKNGLKLALDAFQEHIDHRQTFDSSHKMESYKPIHAEFSLKL